MFANHHNLQNPMRQEQVTNLAKLKKPLLTPPLLVEKRGNMTVGGKILQRRGSLLAVFRLGGTFQSAVLHL
jgi:hypothetical protein